jgi:acetyl esterase
MSAIRGVPVPSPVAVSTTVVLGPAARAFAKATGTRPFLFELGPVEGRKALDQAQSGEIAKPEVEVEVVYESIRVGTDGYVTLRCLRPMGATGRLPVIVYMHGAGWVFGDRLTHDRLTRELAAGTGAVVVFPEYSRSPEARYPVAIEQGTPHSDGPPSTARTRTWTALAWLSRAIPWEAT